VRKLEALRDTPDGRDYMLSLAPWSFMRRLGQGRQAKAFFRFAPRYELAVLRGIGSADLVNPCCVFRFADKTTAQKMYHEIAQAILQDGLSGGVRIALNAAPRTVDVQWDEDWREETDRLAGGG
jgi:hypothetical protein